MIRVSLLKLLVPLLVGVVTVTVTTKTSIHVRAFSMTMMSSRSSNNAPVVPAVNYGSAATPQQKQKIAVFGAGGYIGSCIYGYLQRAGSLYGTGIMGVGSPRAICATNAGSAAMNSILSKNFVLAFADDTAFRLTDMTSVESIQAKMAGMNAGILATQYTYETRPVTMATYGKTPNDKTKELYMESKLVSRPGMSLSSPEYSLEIFKNTLEACKRTKSVRHLVVLETDSEFELDEDVDSDTKKDGVGDKYLQLLEESEIPYTYIQPVGQYENIRDFTFMKGIQSELKFYRPTSIEELTENKKKIMKTKIVSNDGGAEGEENGNIEKVTRRPIICREYIAAVCVQALMTLGWEDNRVIQVEQLPSSDTEKEKKMSPKERYAQPTIRYDKEWCVNSSTIQQALSSIVS